MSIHSLYQLENDCVCAVVYNVINEDKVKVTTDGQMLNGDYLDKRVREMSAATARKHYRICLDSGFTKEQPKFHFHQLQYITADESDKGFKNFADYEEAKIYKDMLPRDARPHIVSIDQGGNTVHRDGSYKSGEY